MELSFADARYYMTGNKWLINVGPWSDKPNTEKRYKVSQFHARSRLEQTMPRGLYFRICIFSAYPDSATFQLELDRPDNKTCLTLYRLELKAISGHGNTWDSCVPEEFRGRVFKQGETHEHSCLDHVTADGSTIKSKGVHAARSVSPDLTSYDDAFRHACDTLRIQNREVVPPSNVQWPLLGKSS